MRHYVYFLTFFLLIVASCRKSDVKPENIKLTIDLGKDTTISLASFKEPFTIVSSKDNIATIERQGESLKITSNKVGYLELRIIDANNKEQRTIQIWVHRPYRLFEVKSHNFIIETTAQEIKEEIESELKANNSVPLNTLFGIKSLSNSQLHVFPNGIDGEEIKGEISFDPKTRMISLSYNGLHYEYLLEAEAGNKLMSTKMDTSPVIKVNLLFIENFTEFFKTKYPGKDIQNVIRIHRLVPFNE